MKNKDNIKKECLYWDKSMTSKQAAHYHLTGGFVAVELYRAVERENKLLKEKLEEIKKSASKVLFY